MAHITETHRSLLDGFRATYDADWLPRAMSAVVIGCRELSITAGAKTRLPDPTVRWRRRRGQGKRSGQKVKCCVRRLRHTALPE